MDAPTIPKNIGPRVLSNVTGIGSDMVEGMKAERKGEKYPGQRQRSASMDALIICSQAEPVLGQMWLLPSPTLHPHMEIRLKWRPNCAEREMWADRARVATII